MKIVSEFSDQYICGSNSLTLESSRAKNLILVPVLEKSYKIENSI
jgi:hypothetical protein